jgi:hypothetical protein
VAVAADRGLAMLLLAQGQEGSVVVAPDI